MGKWTFRPKHSNTVEAIPVREVLQLLAENRASEYPAWLVAKIGSEVLVELEHRWVRFISGRLSRQFACGNDLLVWDRFEGLRYMTYGKFFDSYEKAGG